MKKAQINKSFSSIVSNGLLDFKHDDFTLKNKFWVNYEN